MIVYLISLKADIEDIEWKVKCMECYWKRSK